MPISLICSERAQHDLFDSLLEHECLVVGIYSSLLFIPQVLGFDTSSLQSFAFDLFLLMYLGLGFGILRFRLFGLGEWWSRIVFWVAAMFLLVGLDMAFLVGLNLSERVSLSAALLICGIFWFPVRSFIQGRLLNREPQNTATFKQVVDIALAPPGRHRTEAYLKLLSAQTVAGYVKIIYQKLHVSNRVEMLQAANRRKLI